MNKTNLFLTLFTLIMLGVANGCNSKKPIATEDSNSLSELRIIEPLVKLGDFEESEDVTSIVTVINESTKTVKLQQLALSCGCMSTDFSPNSLHPGDKYEFNVSVSMVGLGDGWQHGIISTDSDLFKELRFRFEYNVRPSTHLFPDKFLLTKDWQANKSWPLSIDFSIESLKETVHLSRPLYIEPDISSLYRSPINYSLPQRNTLEPGGTIDVTLDRGTFESGFVNDAFFIVAESGEKKLRFRVQVSGKLSVE